MTLFLRNISDLDLDDPRRWEPPEDETLRFLWDTGRVSVSSLCLCIGLLMGSMDHSGGYLCKLCLLHHIFRPRLKILCRFFFYLSPPTVFELLSLHEKRCNNAQEPNPRDCTPQAKQQKQSRRRRRLIHECINRELPLSKRHAKGLGYHPRTMGVDTNDSHAKPSTHSAVTSCNCCGITHWRRHCPNRDQRAPVLGSETKSKSAAGSDRSSCEIKE